MDERKFSSLIMENLDEIFESAGVTATPAQMAQIGNDIKIAIYRNNLTVIEAVKTEMDKLTAKIQADKLRAIEIKNTIYNKGGML